MSETNLTSQLTTLSNNLNSFINEVKAKKLSQMATDKWTVKEVLCHITSWHEYYAANYKALADGKKPVLYDGSMADINIKTVNDLKRLSLENLIVRLLKANKSLEKSIVTGKVSQMTYTKNGTVYKTPKFLEVVNSHILTHTKQVRLAK